MPKILKEDIANDLRLSMLQFNHYIQEIKRQFRIPPPTKLILKYFRDFKPTKPPVAGTIAKFINENNNYPLKIDKEANQPPMKVAKSTLARAQKKYEKNILFRNLLPESNSKQNVVPYSKFDNERVSEEKLEHCPHGVPKTRVCAICDPEKFREITGID